MAIADFSVYKAALALPILRLAGIKSGFSNAGAGRFHSRWVATFDGAAAAPTAAALCDRATVGAIPLHRPAAASMALISANIVGTSVRQETTALLVDRVAHSGGLDGTVITEQVLNLPTPTLTRYVGGVGVFVALETYTAIGATARTATVRYTNAAAGASKTTQATVFGGTGFMEAQNVVPLALADADTGVRAVQGVTLSASTGTAGNFGVTLFVPLAIVPVQLYANGRQGQTAALFGNGAVFRPLLGNECLQLWLLPGGGASEGNYHYSLGFGAI